MRSGSICYFSAILNFVLKANDLVYADLSSQPSPPSFSASSTSLSPSYLDLASSWDINEEALKEFVKVGKIPGNSSGISPHSKYLRLLEIRAAKIIYDKIHQSSAENNSNSDQHSEASLKSPELQQNLRQIYFIPTPTIANNVAILGVAYKNPKCHLITSKIEHKSVLNVFKELEKQGYQITYLDVDSHGKVDLEKLKQSIRPDTKLISIQTVNSEIGTLQDLKNIGAIAKEYGILFHSDASQAFCKYPIDVDAMHIDLLTIAGYKVGAPKGIAALYVRDSTKLKPIFFGSGDDLIPGSRSTPLICAFAKAVETFSFDKERLRNNFETLKNELLKIRGNTPEEEIYINSSDYSHVLSVSIAGVLLKDILDRLPQFSFSAGCSCIGRGKSNVIEAIDPQGKLPACTLRLSFSDKTNPESLKIFAKKLGEVVKKLRKEKKIKGGCEQEQSSESKTQKELNKSLDEVLNRVRAS